VSLWQHARHIRTMPNFGIKSSMVKLEVIRKVRLGICGVGVLRTSLDEYKKDPQNVENFPIIGTGFMVRPKTIVTNRHVIKGMRKALTKLSLSDDQRFLQFVFPRTSGFSTSLCGVEFASTIDNPELDVGFIDFTPQPAEGFDGCTPLEVNDDPAEIHTGQPVGIFGYPHGSKELGYRFGPTDKEIYRFGPVLQQGYISAVAPLDGHPPYSRILSDVRTINGMSGSPLFRAETGTVLGIHHAGNKTTTAYAIPLLNWQLDELLKVHRDERKRLEEEQEKA
jgi:hypothetical protein